MLGDRGEKTRDSDGNEPARGNILYSEESLSHGFGTVPCQLMLVSIDICTVDVKRWVEVKTNDSRSCSCRHHKKWLLMDRELERIMESRELTTCD